MVKSVRMDNDLLIPDHDGSVQHSFDCVANLDASSPAEYRSTMRDKPHLLYSSRGFDQREGNETWNRNDGSVPEILGSRTHCRNWKHLKVKSHWRRRWTLKLEVPGREQDYRAAC